MTCSYAILRSTHPNSEMPRSVTTKYYEYSLAMPLSCSSTTDSNEYRTEPLGTTMLLEPGCDRDNYETLSFIIIWYVHHNDTILAQPAIWHITFIVSCGAFFVQ